VARIEELWSYEGRRAVVTGCASGIGAQVAQQLSELGAQVIGLDRSPALGVNDFRQVDLSDRASIDRAAASIEGPVDALFNLAGVSSGIGDPLLVVTINFLGLRHLTEALIPRMPAGSSIVSVSSLAAASYREHGQQVAPLLRTATMHEGVRGCESHLDTLGNGYQLSKEAIILYTMSSVVELGKRGIRINCTGPGVTETPILDQLRTAYGPSYLDGIAKPLGRICEAAEQAAVLVFLNSRAASYISGQVVWVDGGNVGATIAAELEEGRA